MILQFLTKWLPNGCPMAAQWLPNGCPMAALGRKGLIKLLLLSVVYLDK
jgi:hypothetical protein